MYSGKLSATVEGERKTFHNMNTNKFRYSRSTFNKILEGILQADKRNEHGQETIGRL